MMDAMRLGYHAAFTAVGWSLGFLGAVCLMLLVVGIALGWISMFVVATKRVAKELKEAFNA